MPLELFTKPSPVGPANDPDDPPIFQKVEIIFHGGLHGMVNPDPIDLCLTLFPWVEFRKRKGAVKLHTLLDLHGNISSVVIITTGKVHDVNILDQLLIELGATYIVDRG